MGKGKKSSRKAKKAWRADISSQDVDDYIERAGREERSGGPLDGVPSESLFFVDKSADTLVLKKTRKHQEKMLHCDHVLKRTSLVPALLHTSRRKSKKKKVVKSATPCHEDIEIQKKLKGCNFDIWGLEDKNSNPCNDNDQGVQPKKVRNSEPVAAIVEVDAPGCSYNPRFEDHQEAIGLAVADEMRKVYQKELEPPPIPRTVIGNAIDEEDVYFLDVGDDVDGADLGGTSEGDCGPVRHLKVKKLSRADKNRKRRRKEILKLEDESSKRKKIQTDVTRIDEIIRDIEDEEQEKQREWTRRTISKQEKRALGPPRLGKYKFEPEPIQVLLSEDVTGSLRKLKGCYTLVRERYKSLQRHGLIEPRLPVKRRAGKKRVHYEQGTKGQKEREMHFAMKAEQAASRKKLE